MEVAQYTVGGSFSTVGRWLQYCGGYSVQWRITSVHVGDNISTVADNISIVDGLIQ